MLLCKLHMHESNPYLQCLTYVIYIRHYIANSKVQCVHFSLVSRGCWGLSQLSLGEGRVHHGQGVGSMKDLCPLLEPSYVNSNTALWSLAFRFVDPLLPFIDFCMGIVEFFFRMLQAGLSPEAVCCP